jgi:hypothetical protein
MVLINAFSTREVDERMERLYDEILSAKETICDSKPKHSLSSLQSKRILYLTNLKKRIEERLARKDMSDEQMRK